MIPTKTEDKKDRLSLIAYRGDRAACWFYRLHAPLIHVAKNNPDFDITVSGAITKEQLEQKFDIVILQRQYKMDVLAPVLELKKKGSKLIYEIDDNLFDIPKWNPAHKILSKKSVQAGIRRFLSEIDAIFVTTEDLQGVYNEFCEHVYVLPNSIDYTAMYEYPDNSKKPVVCWQGSLTHTKDIHIAQRGFEQIAADEDLIFKMWCGLDYKSGKPSFDIKGTEVIQLVPFEAFFQMFSQMGVTVGLAPLAANKFNCGKSNLKFLEYTAQGAVTVASAVGPYKDTIEDGVTGLLVEDNRDWYERVRELIDDPAYRAEILANAQDLVQKEYNIETNYVLWEKAIREIAGRK